jgi:hypothetical protein
VLAVSPLRSWGIKPTSLAAPGQPTKSLGQNSVE